MKVYLLAVKQQLNNIGVLYYFVKIVIETHIIDYVYLYRLSSSVRCNDST